MIKYLNSQKYSECQLVTAINACLFLGEPGVDPESEEYERLVDLTCGRIGACIGIEKAWGHLRLKAKQMPCNIASIKASLRRGRPVGISMKMHDYGGFHDVLATDIIETKNDYLLQVHNVKSNYIHIDKKNRLSWKSNLKSMRRYHPNMRSFHSFYVDPWRKYGAIRDIIPFADKDSWFSKKRRELGGKTPLQMCIDYENHEAVEVLAFRDFLKEKSKKDG